MALPTGKRKYQIEQLWDNHQEIIRRLAVGQKGTDIAKDMGISPVTVSYVKNSALGRRQLDILQGAANKDVIDVRKRISEAAIAAVAVMEEIVTSPDHNMGLRLRASQDILDRAGYAAPKVLRTENLHAVLTNEDIENIKRRAKEFKALPMSYHEDDQP